MSAFRRTPSPAEAFFALREVVNTILATSDDELALHLTDPRARARTAAAVEQLERDAPSLHAAAADMDSAAGKLRRALAATGEALA